MTTFLKEWCTYSTPRIVRLRDWRLGLLYYGLMFLIFFYIVVYSVVLQQKFRIKALDIVGATRLQLRPPAPAYQVPASASRFCGNGTVNYNGGVVQQYPCRFYDQYDAVDPFLEQRAMFISTRITETPQTISEDCEDQPNQGCRFVDGPDDTYYIGDIEMFTVLLDHTFSSSSLKMSQGEASMSGRLIDQNGVVMNPCDDYTAQGFVCDPHVHISRSATSFNSADVMPLRTLLRAAGIGSLDDTTLVLNETHRYAGIILVVTVSYSNFLLTTGSYSQDQYTYTYSVQSVQDAEFKAEQILPASGSSSLNRTILDRHGVRLIIAQTGEIGAFDFATLLISLTSSLGLLAVASLVVDFMATSVLPLRAVYRQYKKIDSIDVSDMKLDEDDLRTLAAVDVVNPPPPPILKRLGGKSSKHMPLLDEESGDYPRVAEGATSSSGGGPLSANLSAGGSSSALGGAMSANRGRPQEGASPSPRTSLGGITLTAAGPRN